jgi:hypothetical protein
MRRLPLVLGGFLLLAVCALWVAALPSATSAIDSPDGKAESQGHEPKGGCPPSWQVVSSPVLTSTLSTLDGLAVISTTDAWVIGNASDQWEGVIEHWNGTEWSAVPPAPLITSTVIMLAIDATGPDDVWIAGHRAALKNSRPLLEHWNGTQWQVVSVAGTLEDDSYVLFGIDAITPTDAWAVGYVATSTGSDTFVVHWDGTEWQVVPSPNGGALSNALYDVSAVSPNDVWAAGRYRLPDGTYQPLTMHWDGATWTSVPAPSGSKDIHNVRGVKAIAPDDVWLVGNYLEGGFFRTLTMHWDGTQWSVIASPNLVQYNNHWLMDVEATAPNDVWAAGYYSDGYTDHPLVLHWDGIAWTVAPTPALAEPARLEVIESSPKGDLWAGGLIYHDGTEGNERSMLLMRYSTACPPATATPTPTQPASPTPTACVPGSRPVRVPRVGAQNYLHALYAASANDIWAVGEYWPARSVRTMPLIQHWNGTAWSIVPANPAGVGSEKLWGVHGIKADDIWAVGEYYDPLTEVTSPLAKHWNGTTWANVPVQGPGTLKNVLRDVVALAPNDVRAVGSYYDYPYDFHTLIMHWNGTQWSVVNSPNPGSAANVLNAIAVGPTGELWAVGYKRDSGSSGWPLVLKSNGASWYVVTEALENEPRGGGLNDITVDATGAWAVGTYSAASVGATYLVERWNGESWSVAPSPVSTNGELEAVAVGQGSDAWAVGNKYPQPTVLHWNGQDWTTSIVSGVEGGGSKLDDVLVLPSGEVWAAGFEDEAPLIVRNDRSCTCSIEFSDVPTDSTFSPFVTCLACRQIVSGYPCGGPGEPCDPFGNAYYRPDAQVTRGQIAKIVSLAASPPYIPPDWHSFQDVPPGSTFWLYVEHMKAYGFVSGYLCGGPDEPCVPPENRPYFRPGANATRGQISKVVALASYLAGYPPETQQTFEDVAPNSTFWRYVESLVDYNIISGYPCGGPGEPCGPENRPYFRSNNPTTRGQMAKFTANAFYPNCANLRP